jgi:hypothetical protein
LLTIVAQAFALVVFIYLCASEDLPPSFGDAMRDGSGRSRPMRAGFLTGTRRCRSFEEAHSLLGRRVCAYRERRKLLQKL